MSAVLDMAFPSDTTRETMTVIQVTRVWSFSYDGEGTYITALAEAAATIKVFNLPVLNENRAARSNPHR
jgi:hypothetical protein